MASIVSISPGSGTTGQGIGINGTGFTGVTAVRFGGTNAASFSVIDANTIVAYVAAGTTGSIEVDTDSGTVSIAGFTFVPPTPPVVTSFTPIAAIPGQEVTITGSNFTGVTSVLFGGVAALYFRIIDDNTIVAYPNFGGSTTVSAVNAGGIGSQIGFTLLLKQIRLIDLPVLGRDVATTDLQYVWDMTRSKLCQAPVSAFPAGTGGGGGDTGNIFTALGSPFKVRIGDDNYSFTPGTGGAAPGEVVITDVRLLGKQDYVISATDVSGEFENDRLTYDQDAGTVTISNYQLTTGSHITIYADGVVTTQLQEYIASQQATLNKLLLVAAPFLPSVNSLGVLTNPGGIVAWMRPAIEIPDGWAEWVPGRGNDLRGQDPADVVTDDNPEGLARTPGSAGGSRAGVSLVNNNLPLTKLYIFSQAGQAGNITGNILRSPAWSSNHTSGNQDYDMKAAVDDNATAGLTSAFGKATPDPVIPPLDPYRIVNFIYSTQTA